MQYPRLNKLNWGCLRAYALFALHLQLSENFGVLYTPLSEEHGEDLL